MGDRLSSPGQIISLPQGGGSLQGLGETFSPDLFTGTGNVTIPLTTPAGRNNVQPTLSLLYSTGAGNGPFGLGWRLGVPEVSRKTAKGVPIYDDSQDVFLMSNSEDLVPVFADKESTTFRPRTDSAFAQIAHYTSQSDNYWEARLKDGTTQVYGTPGQAGSDPAVLANPTNSHRVFSWHLAASYDPFGNRIAYEYEIDKSQDERCPWQQIYLSAIRYIDYGDQPDFQYLVSVRFHYETRQDAFSSRRAGFEIRTTRLCKEIEVFIGTGEKELIRRYTLHHEQAPFNGNALLTRVSTTGYAGEQSEQLPPVQFRYTDFVPEKQRFIPLTGKDSPSGSLAHPDYELVDIDGNGLPGFLSMDGNAQYWRNLGAGKLDARRSLPVIPAGVRLQDPGAQLIDANGDGHIDLMVCNERFGGYYPLTAQELEGQRFYQPYRVTPSIDLKDPEVRLVDLTGNGITDAIRSGTRMECFFNDPIQGWNSVREVARRALDEFPNVNFSDSRVQLGCMTGDNLQDIVLIANGHVEYWPSLGHGNWGARIIMKNSPRFPYGYNPHYVLLGDVDGDGVADLVYVDDHKVSLWINQNGNSWSEEVSISGTPSVADANALRLTDILGNGVSGVLWSSPANGTQPSMHFLDFTGGVKPYLLSGIVNNSGAETHIEYASSIKYYLEDEQNRATRWKTSLPFPVQVISRVVSFDRFSGSSLTTEYFYHHGYWDGVEREFRGFGRVDQLDTLHYKDLGPSPHYSPPTETRTWFHLGPISTQFAGRPYTADFTNEYWSEDPDVLPVPPLPAGLKSRGERDALRALRGRILRTELYALDESNFATRPYQVSEHSHGVRLEVKPGPGTPRIPGVYFPYTCAQRTTAWERGTDPYTIVTFLDDYDAYGQEQKTTTIAVPRGRDYRHKSPISEPYLATLSTVHYAPAPDPEHFMVNRITSQTQYEIQNNGTMTLLELHTEIITNPARQSLFSHSLHFYDGEAFVGLPLGKLGNYGAPVRIEELVLTAELLREAYQSEHGPAIPPYLVPDVPPPWTPEYPAEFREEVSPLAGYHYQIGAANGIAASGYYTATRRYCYDFQTEGAGHRGMQVAQLDPMGNRTTIDYDAFDLLPCVVTDANGLVLTTNYNYRTMLPHEYTDFNGNRTLYTYTPLGHVASEAVMGKEGQNVGDTPQTPSTRWIYDFMAFIERGQPISVRTIHREYYSTDASVPPPLRDQTISKIEYSDSFGRLLQTRMQGEEIRFGDPISGDNVLPADQSQPGGTTIGNAPEPGSPPRTVISGWQIYDNKGRIAEKFEPFFAQGWDYAQPTEQERGQRTLLAYDPPGRLILTVHPDGSEEQTIYGVPVDITRPGIYIPTPWETYVYDANDNAGRTDPLGSHSYEDHWNTPTSTTRDALGREVKTVTRNGRQPENWYSTLSTYDIRGNLLTLVDQLGRTAFRYIYDLANRQWRVEQLDSGIKRQVLNADGQVVELRDSRGALKLYTYDQLVRSRQIWARDQENLPVTSREYLIYGDSPDSGLTRQEAAERNLLSTLYKHFDEAGLLTFSLYDFKMNVTEKERQVINDNAMLANQFPAEVSGPARAALLDPESYQCSYTYDALNRIKTMLYPRDVLDQRKEFRPLYNRAAALKSVKFGGELYIEHIAYDARGQRTLIAYGNGIMTRYAYDEQTFRLVRMRSEEYTLPAPFTYQPTGAAPLQDYGYDYDLIGNPLVLHDRTPGDGVPPQSDQLDRAFRYDPLYRLLTATGRECNFTLTDPWNDAPRCQNPAGTRLYSETYTYDPAYNLIRLDHQADGNSFTRNLDLFPDTNRLATLRVGENTFAYHYDENGNLDSEATSRRFVWDHRNCMIHFTTQAEGSQQPLLANTYSYDSAGLRVKKLTRNQAGQNEFTITIDGIFEVQRLGSGPEMRENNLLHILDTTQRIALIRVGPPLPDDPAPPVQYLLADQLDSSNVVVSLDGAWINREEYTPFGETSFGSFSHKRFRFTGKERDEESGLYYFGARYMPPWLARWMSPDPGGTVDGLDLYTFVKNNPMKFVDHDGQGAHVRVLPARGSRVRPVITIRLEGILVDQTGTLVTQMQRRNIVRRMARQFARSYAGANPAGTVDYRGTLRIRTTGAAVPRIRRSEHVIRIVAPGTIPGTGGALGVLGRAPFGQNVAYISSATIPHVPAVVGPHAGTGRSVTGNGTLERTGTHELGHSMSLVHPVPGTLPGNLMHQTAQPNAGLNVNFAQITHIQTQHNLGNLNQGAQV
ncbi:MAG TPA: SpvB/TcaC N-terminal domain-containing protein [Ktedonobacteraceae bacterium]